LPGKVPELEDFSTDLPAISLPEVTEEAAESSFPSEPLQSIDEERVRIAKEQEERHNQLERILARADQTGFKGFCPVALRDQRQLVDADPELKAEFGLQTYTFSSAEAKAAFEANPTRYAPVAGGNDVVAEAADGVQKPGRLDYSLWYRDRLYLFESRENMAAFHQSPRKFAAAE
jgi:YHS domain-containing protein